MRVIWQEPAKVGRRQVAAYIRKEFGTKRAKKFKQEVDDTVKQLMHSPGIGQIDPLFSDRAMTYRSVIINGLNKLVYFVNDDTIYIAGFWDTRREPTDEAAQTE
ncbi:type II toxin-antitoxin system RelE/ParE family toxin [Prevotella sp. E13-27]|uniref:type II toxin-antitoxin system RelE/ParE family toxin n=1 Tax=Prevotella sp. E13-27 TaxID=2938122 RepID=UPI00200AA787|nr:type II toxin-antitoxin system RelE/ParE family toxin [Prevotella sp. E13-27]MCK8621567.1 type II toxin-antitoxin system RelE/ParE family toxin [Prevotella sp. E13-27]